MTLFHCFKNTSLFLLGTASLILISTVSCRTDFDFEVSQGHLRFSKDTVFLDTIFANISSGTYTLKVYNDSDTDIEIPQIMLKKRDSRYRLNVDGQPGRTFRNIPLRSKDSLFVFIETTLPSDRLDSLEFLHADALQFVGSEQTQEVPLITLVRDATFLYPRKNSEGISETLLLDTDSEGNDIRVDGFFLNDEELVFTNQKPYVIYGYAAVPEGKSLVVEAGARVHFHTNSGLIISPNASLHVNGKQSDDDEALENEVVFEGDRLESRHKNTPGQWGTVWFLSGSTNNRLTNLTLKNATIGLLCEGTTATANVGFELKNVQVHNSSVSNLWARTASLNAENCVFGNAGGASLYCHLGGAYDFKHCTIANYWTHSFRNSTALSLDNYEVTQDGTLLVMDLTKAYFGNCIIDGNRPTELSLSQNNTKPFHFQFHNCLLKFDATDSNTSERPLYDFSNGNLYHTIWLNLDSDFTAPNTNDFSIGGNSAAIGNGDPMISIQVPLDIKGNPRGEPSDIGAYKHLTVNL